MRWAKRRAAAIAVAKARRLPDATQGNESDTKVERVYQSRMCVRCSATCIGGAAFCVDCSAMVQRQISRMREVGRTVSEIAEEVGLSVYAVEQRICRAKKRVPNENRR